MEMPASLENLVQDPVLARFLEITGIARPTGHEERMAEFVLRHARPHPEIEVARDSFGNIRLRVPPRPASCAGAPWVILQAHLDMVCTRDANAGEFDPAQGKIRVIRVDELSDDLVESECGEWLAAYRTTLGADNGLGVAMMLALIDDQEAVFGPLDLCFTLHEEEGLKGADNLDPNLLRGHYLINLDTEEDDEVTIGSAGGRDVQFRWARDKTPVDRDWHYLVLAVSGLRGGHSGVDINSGRLNAIHALVRLLQSVATHCPMRLTHIEGGDKSNAIPRSAHAVIAVPPDGVPGARASASSEWEMLVEQYRGLESRPTIEFREIEAPRDKAFTPQDTSQLLAALRAIPTGVVAMSQDIPGLVETSNNLGVIKTVDDAAVEWVCSPRSSLAGAMADVTETLLSIGKLSGTTTDPGSEYPGWKPEPGSPLVAVVKECYANLFGSQVKVMAYHAGLECSVIKSKLPHLACVSIGPTIKGAHSPSERVRIDSIGKSYKLLKSVLRELSTHSA